VNFVLIMLCGILMGAFNFGFLILGYYLGTKKPREDGVVATKENKEFIKEMMRWRNYNG